MQTVVLAVHLMLAVALVGSVLLQKSEGGALGMGGGGMSGFMSGRSTANLLTRTTAILAACFFATSIVLVLMATQRGEIRSLVDQPATNSQTVPAAPSGPAVPVPPASTTPPASQGTPAPVVPTPPAEPTAPAAK